MDILRETELVSSTFVIYPGKQVTLYATGLVGDDTAYVELLHLSRAPEFTGNPCCVVTSDITVLSSTPLLCSDGNAVVMTAEYPWVVISAPQNVPLRVVLSADTAALVTVELHETDSDGCMECTCRCVDTEWQDTGDVRCVNGNVESEQTSNCGSSRWVVTGAQTWTPTGDERCVSGNVEHEETNNCGASRWVVDRVQTWTATGDQRCVNGNVELEEVNDCNDTRWVVDRVQTWTATGDQRCVNGNVELEEVNDCGGTRWTIIGPETWTPTGQQRCVGGNVERQESNNCGAIRWVVVGPQTWTPTGDERCVNGNVERKEVNDCCCETRWVVDRVQTWTATSVTRCQNNLLENQEVNDCGITRWTATTTVCGYCPSSPVPLDKTDGQSAYAYREGDARDPAATVEISSCDGEEPSVWIYPSAAPGHSIPVYDCDGVLIGYGANTSSCVSNEVARVEILSLPEIQVEPLVVAQLPALTIQSLPEITIARHAVEAIQVGNEIWVYWSDGTKTIETLPVNPTTTVYCPSQRLSSDGEPGFGYHEADPKDPAATVEMAPCPGDTSVDSIWIYPSAGTGHTVKVVDCDGTLIGYAANTSTCAPDCGCSSTSVNVVNQVSSATPNVIVSNTVPTPSVTVNNQIPAPATVASIAYQGDNLVITMTDGTTRTAGPNFCP